MEANCILSHLRFLVSAGEVTECADRGFRDVFPVSSPENCAHESLNATNLAHHHLVLVVVAGKVGKDASGTSHNINVI